MKINLKIIIGLALFFISCNQDRIYMISENSKLKLPENYKVVENSSTGFGQSVTITLKFDEKTYFELKKQIDSLTNVANSHWWKVGVRKEINYHYEPERGQVENIFIFDDDKTLTYNFFHIP